MLDPGDRRLSAGGHSERHNPDEAEPAIGGLIGTEFRILEIPLNSPDALVSIRRAAERYGADAIIGAGTVLRPEEMREVQAAGGRLIVASNFSPLVAAACRELGLCRPRGRRHLSQALSRRDDPSPGGEGLARRIAEAGGPASSRRHRARHDEALP
ncbi:hypothetical protein [Pleomorphomonas koreensis]|uniref:hypothetical protein n=1 Tax=Pleomorphomonas koreensis TaxID=257440 RepID=UPI0012EBBBCE